MAWRKGVAPVGQRLVRRENINLPVGDPYFVKARCSDPISNIPFPAFCLQVLGQLTVTSSSCWAGQGGGLSLSHGTGQGQVYLGLGLLQE